ncbi:MAG: hypothetical protein R6W80_05200 [Haliea sp.]
MNITLPRVQKGVVLVVALILLLALTLIAVTASNLVRTNLTVIQNIESRDMARFAANAALEEAISSNRFTATPGTIFIDNCGADNRKCYDFNNDLVNDVIVDVESPTCVVVTPIENSELDAFNSPADASCYLPPGVYSMCARSVWEFRAVATDVISGAEVAVRQGVSVLTTLNNIEAACPDAV